MKRLAVAILVVAGITTLSAQPRQSPLQRLQSSIERITASVNATWGIYVKSIETNEEVAIGADRQMETMSTIKIPLMIEVFEQIKAGKFKLTDKYTFDAADLRGGTGVIRSLEPGAVLTVKDLITLMVIVSDNTATDVLYKMVGGPDAVNRRMGYLRGNDVYDSLNRRMAFIRDADVYSATNNRMDSVANFQKRIQGAPEGPVAVALMLLLAKSSAGA